jgi:hypothetical protein
MADRKLTFAEIVAKLLRKVPGGILVKIIGGHQRKV